MKRPHGQATFDWFSEATTGNRLIVSRPLPVRHPNRRRPPLRRWLPRLSLRWRGR